MAMRVGDDDRLPLLVVIATLPLGVRLQQTGAGVILEYLRVADNRARIRD
jgi:hypothetical protein